MKTAIRTQNPYNVCRVKMRIRIVMFDTRQTDKTYRVELIPQLRILRLIMQQNH